MNLKPNTLYKVLLRLEDNRLVTLTSNNKYTIFTICNWKKYQSVDNTKSNNTVTTGEQPGNNQVTLKQELRMENEDTKATSRVAEIADIFNYYKACFGTPTIQLSKARTEKLRVRLGDAGKDMLVQAITNTANSSFHRGDNDRGWKANIDWIIKSYEQVEKLSQLSTENRKKYA